jgi:hypothetical protein
MGYVPYVGFATHRRASMRIHSYFKRLMIKQYELYKNKKKWVVTDAPHIKNLNNQNRVKRHHIPSRNTP